MPTARAGDTIAIEGNAPQPTLGGITFDTLP